MANAGNPLTEKQAKSWANRLVRVFPNSPIACGYNFGQWWVIFGVDFLGTVKRVKEYAQTLLEEEAALVASLDALDAEAETNSFESLYRTTRRARKGSFTIR